MQLRLPLPLEDNSPRMGATSLSRETFSHNGVAPQDQRIALEKRYSSLLEETDVFDRRLVSYQGNKGEILHSWIKYREGFSAQLVQTLIRKFGIRPQDTILDPFAGSATTLLVAKTLGINAIGIELLPVCHLAWRAKSHVFDYDLAELERVLSSIVETEPDSLPRSFPHLVITESAFPEKTESDLMFYTEWVQSLDVTDTTRVLLKLILASILEEVSFTRKDGQYLRWDSRSVKVRNRNKVRITQGKKPFKGLSKGELPMVKESFVRALRAVSEDIRKLQAFPLRGSSQRLIEGNTLMVLPTLESGQFHGVITSPPYCNRYDYTRTYALELAYLGIGEKGIRDLRQDQLSCTVENRPKVELLRNAYKDLGKEARFSEILNTIWDDPTFKEINHALRIRWDRGEMNNRGVLSMVEGYFIELTFTFAEIYRTCKAGAHVAFVNDNVRYGGEVIPVDLLSTRLAEKLGFEPVKVYVLPQRKGNSSQQMGKFGREALRKSITVWRRL